MTRRFLLALLFALTVPAVHAQDNSQAIDHAKKILELLRQERFSEVAAEFNTQVAAALSAERLGQAWSGLRSQVGDFRSIIDQQTGNPPGVAIAVRLGCEFERAGINMNVAFDKDNKIAGLTFTPRPPQNAAEVSTSSSSDKFIEEQVAVGAGEWVLPGTLSIPVGSGKVPAVVLVHGSGPNDRDGTIGQNKPLRDIAWGLAERGIAALRYDKRTRRYGPKMSNMPSITVREETVDDALLAVKVLRTHARIDAARIFVIGHSLGATLAPRIAADDPALAGVVIMAGYTRPLPELIIEQTEYLSSLPGAPPQANGALETMKQQARRAMDPDLPIDTPKEQLLGAYPAYWKDLNSYKPAEVAATLKMPILILQGERDYQVTLKDLDGWRTTLAGRSNVTIKTYPDLNHIFIAGEGKSTRNEYRIAGRIPARILNDIADWIRP